MKYILISFLAVMFCIAIGFGCAKAKDSAYPKPESQNGSTGSTEGMIDKDSKDRLTKYDANDMPEEADNNKYKESVLKVKNIAKPQKFTIITDLASFTNSCINIHKPEQAVLHLFNALGVCTEDKDRGLQFLKEILSEKAFISEEKPNPKTIALLKKLEADVRIFNSYIGGVKPDYEPPASNAITVSFFRDKNYQVGQNRWKIFIQSAGKLQHTTIVVENVNERWRIIEFDEVFTKLSEDSN